MKPQKRNPVDPPHAAEADAGDDAGMEAFMFELPLARPSGQLDKRVQRVLAGTLAARRVRTLLVAIAAGLALCVGIAPLLLRRARTVTQTIGGPPPVKATPVGIARQLRIEQNAAHLADGGIIGFAGKVPIHGYRYESVRQIWYVDPHGRRLCVTIPNERVVLVPVHPF